MKNMLVTLVLSLLLVSCSSTQKNLIDSAEQVEQHYQADKKVVLVTHPHCEYSNLAFKNFTPKIETYLKKNGVIFAPISPIHQAEELDGVREWNSSHELKHIAVLNTVVPLSVSLASTPQFLFFKDGELVNKVVGWPKNNGNALLVEQAIAELDAM